MHVGAPQYTCREHITIQYTRRVCTPHYASRGDIHLHYSSRRTPQYSSRRTPQYTGSINRQQRVAQYNSVPPTKNTPHAATPTPATPRAVASALPAPPAAAATQSPNATITAGTLCAAGTLSLRSYSAPPTPPRPRPRHRPPRTPAAAVPGGGARPLRAYAQRAKNRGGPRTPNITRSAHCRASTK